MKRVIFGTAMISIICATHALAADLAWRPPHLDNPETKNVTSRPGDERLVLDDAKDYIIKVGPESGGAVTLTELKIIGGHNVVLIGGYITRAEGTPTNDAKTGAPVSHSKVTVNLLGQTGTTYVEGLLIDNSGQFGVDGLDLGGADIGGQKPSGDFILQNIHIRGVSGTEKARNKKGVAHADGLQLWGPIRSLKIDYMTVYSGYQGINLQPESDEGGVDLRHVNLRYPDPDSAHGQANGYALWLSNGYSFTGQAAYSFSDVYIEPRQIWNAGWDKTSIAPDKTMPHGAQATGSGQATWPSLDDAGRQSVTGTVTAGIPPEGDFCPPEHIAGPDGTIQYRANKP